MEYESLVIKTWYDPEQFCRALWNRTYFIRRHSRTSFGFIVKKYAAIQSNLLILSFGKILPGTFCFAPIVAVPRSKCFWNVWPDGNQKTAIISRVKYCFSLWIFIDVWEYCFGYFEKRFKYRECLELWSNKANLPASH